MAGTDRSFEQFFADVEPRLRSALVARYGPTAGRAATVDALSYAWEHWERVSSMHNSVGYLFRVGQSASRRYFSATVPWVEGASATSVESECVPELVPALASLPERQRLAVVLVHGLGWTHRDAAELLEVSRSTIQTHVERALLALRIALEAANAQR